VPEVDFMTLCEHVRMDGGLLHVIGAGIDRIGMPAVPSGFNMGIALRLALTRNECNRPHDIEIIVQHEDGVRIAVLNASVTAQYPQNQRAGWHTFAAFAVNMGVPIPGYGAYSIELLVGGQSKRSISFLVEKPPPPMISGV
jgi:hypothetical protein